LIGQLQGNTEAFIIKNWHFKLNPSGLKFSEILVFNEWNFHARIQMILQLDFSVILKDFISCGIKYFNNIQDPWIDFMYSYNVLTQGISDLGEYSFIYLRLFGALISVWITGDCGETICRE
jgi:hypothetical protein